MRKLDPEKHAARRQQILDAAVVCFARNGFHLTRTAQICAEAGMSPGNLFHYFPSKDAIIAAIVEEDRRETLALFTRAAAADDLYAALLDLIDHSLQLLGEPLYRRISLEVLAEAVRNPALFADVASGEAARRAALIGLLQRGAQRGQLRLLQSAEQAADWLLLLLDGAFGRAMLEDPFAERHYRQMLHQALSAVVQQA